MTITVNINDTDLDELLAKVEAGEDIILAGDGVPVAQVKSLAEPAFDAEARRESIEKIEAFRANLKRDLINTIIEERAGRKPITQGEIAEWKQIGRK